MNDISRIRVSRIHSLEYNFSIRSKVIIDGDASIVARVVAINFDGDGVEYKLSWMHGGDERNGWFQEWRIQEAEA